MINLALIKSKNVMLEVCGRLSNLRTVECRFDNLTFQEVSLRRFSDNCSKLKARHVSKNKVTKRRSAADISHNLLPRYCH
jgi:hypothetical protein